MKDTDYMDLFEMRAERGEVSAEEQLATLRKFGLIIPDEFAGQCFPCGDYMPFLATLGWGKHDFEQKTWTPSSSQVYAFDGEVCFIETMYHIYIQGLQSISEGELTFSDVETDFSHVDWDGPGGKVDVRCTINGIPFQYNAIFQGDWIDTNIRCAVNEHLAKLGISKRFFYTDGEQGEIIFFCAEDWAREFEEATLCYMS